MSRRLWPVLCVLLLSAAHLAGCQHAAGRPNVVLVLIDTLRADRLGSYGSRRGLTPCLDSFAERARVFRRAYAQSSWTHPSVASLFTSRFQSQHRVVSHGSVLADSELTLAEILKQNGYATGLFSANPSSRRELGVSQGFDGYRVFEVNDELLRVFRSGLRHLPKGWKDVFAAGDSINEAALQWTDEVWKREGASPPIFLYVQYMEPHWPYAPPEPILKRLYNGRRAPNVGQTNWSALLGEAGAALSAAQVRDIRGLYDAEVMSVDGHVRSLFSALESRGLLRNAIVIVTADHGEELSEHGWIQHGATLYDTLIHVPLMIRIPGMYVRRDVEQIVALIDIAPTVLDLVGIPVPAAFEGRSLARELQWSRSGWLGSLWRAFGPDTRAVPRPVLSQLITAKGERLRRSFHEQAIVSGSRKLIVTVDGRREFFDLENDPGERRGAALGAADQALLARSLKELQKRASRAISPDQIKTLDEAEKERLRALGYLD